MENARPLVTTPLYPRLTRVVLEHIWEITGFVQQGVSI